MEENKPGIVDKVGFTFYAICCYHSPIAFIAAIGASIAQSIKYGEDGIKSWVIALAFFSSLVLSIASMFVLGKRTDDGEKLTSGCLVIIILSIIIGIAMGTLL